MRINSVLDYLDVGERHWHDRRRCGARVQWHRISNGETDGMQLQRAPTSFGCPTAQNNVITSSGASGIVVWANDSHNCIISDNFVFGNAVYGIGVTGGDGSQILGNRVERNRRDLFWNGVSTAGCYQNVSGTSSPATFPSCWPNSMDGLLFPDMTLPE